MRSGARTPVAVLVVVAIVLIGAVLFVGPVSAGDRDPSSIANGKAGTLALYSWLGTLGFDVHRVEGDFDLSGSDVVISAAPLPIAPFSAADARRLLDHVRGGGDVILAVTDPSAVESVLRPLGVSVAGTTAASMAKPSQPFDPSGAVNTVPLRPPGAGEMPASFTFSAARGELVPLLGDGRHPTSAAVRQGTGGRLYLVGTEYPLSNDGLRRGDSSLFLLSLIERARGGHVGFDEVHHNLGGGGASDQGIGDVFRGPLLAASLLALLVLLVHLVSSGRRLGHPLAGRDPGRVPTAAEYIASIGHLLARSKQRGAVAERYAGELKQRVGGVTGADPRLEDTAFVAAISGFGEDRAQRTGSLLAEARSLASGHPGEAQLLSLARRVDQLEIEWGAGPRS